jgi:hypothetical protein
MGMCAEVIAIGPYSKAVEGMLDYAPSNYANTKNGVLISCRLFGILEGSTLSRQFAALLAISDPWDFNQHRLEVAKVDMLGLKDFGRSYPAYQPDIEAFEVLLNNGFEFHFRPEG